MRRTLGPKQRKLTACFGIFALLALSVLYVVPHSWHKEDGKRSCVVCQAYRTPAAPAASAPAVEPPQAERAPARVPARPCERTPVLPSFDPRAPPFPHGD